MKHLERYTNTSQLNSSVRKGDNYQMYFTLTLRINTFFFKFLVGQHKCHIPRVLAFSLLHNPVSYGEHDLRFLVTWPKKNWNFTFFFIVLLWYISMSRMNQFCQDFYVCTMGVLIIHKKSAWGFESLGTRITEAC